MYCNFLKCSGGSHEDYFNARDKNFGLLSVITNFPPGSKSEPLRLGVHLILLCFIKISLLSAETFFYFDGGWGMVGGGWWMVGGWWSPTF